MSDQYQIELGSEKKRVTVSKFKGRSFVNIREFYQKGDKWLPGSKGIALTADQFNIIADHIDEIKAVLDKLSNDEKKRKQEDDDDDDEEADEEEEGEEKPKKKKFRKYKT